MSTKRKALPKGIAAGEFDKAIKELKAILGDEHVLVDEVRLAPYSKIMMAGARRAARARPPP
jgi:4-cresol dehydrogenase (hydroxylating)